MSRSNPADFNIDTAERLAKYVADVLRAPFVEYQVSALGGKENAAVIIRLSLDPKETWVNKIFHNSRYMFFYIYPSGKIEQFARSHQISKKFRTTHAVSANHIIQKINKYLDSVR